MSDQFSLVLERGQLTVQPGQTQTVACLLTNLGVQPLHVDIRILGTGREWTRPQPAWTSLAPGEQVECQLIVFPPDTLPGKVYPVIVAAVDPAGQLLAQTSLSVRVIASGAFSLDISPRAVTNLEGGRFIVTALNHGASNLTIDLSAEPASGADFDFQPRVLTLRPGETERANLRVTAREVTDPVVPIDFYVWGRPRDEGTLPQAIAGRYTPARPPILTTQRLLWLGIVPLLCVLLWLLLRPASPTNAGTVTIIVTTTGTVQNTVIIEITLTPTVTPSASATSPTTNLTAIPIAATATPGVRGPEAGPATPVPPTQPVAGKPSQVNAPPLSRPPGPPALRSPPLASSLAQQTSPS